MRIMDKYKDYYDFLGHTSEDRTLVYDRRGSTPLSKETVLYHIYHYSRDTSVIFGLQAGFKLFILQAIHLQADFDPKTRILQHVTGDIQLVDSIDNVNWSGQPLQFVELELPFPRSNNRWYTYTGTWDRAYQHQLKTMPVMRRNGNELRIEVLAEKPLLRDTGIPALIPPFEIYKNLEMYISSLKTEKTVDIATNDEKIINHGFDLKSSFRHSVT
ncbi:MAG: hypothetical protein ACTTH7_04305 [Treponema sp.]